MVKIYVSSTYEDLQEYRHAVQHQIRRMGHEDIAMEYYVAEDRGPVDKCLSDVAACDLYIGIFAWRYGSIPKENNPDGLSITELEYRKAVASGKTCLIFLLKDEVRWAPKFVDPDRGKIVRLRSELSAKHVVSQFTCAEDLAGLVSVAIHKWEKDAGGVQSDTGIAEAEHTYYEALRRRYQTVELEGLTPPQREENLQIRLPSIFVGQSVRQDPPPVELPKEVWERLAREKDVQPEDFPEIELGEIRRAREVYYEKPLKSVLSVVSDPQYQQVVILGDPGSGKSTLARYILLSVIGLAENENLRSSFANYLPLLIELRTYAGLYSDRRCDTFLEYLEHLGKTEGWGLTETMLQNFLKNDGRAVVLFDGLDEILDAEDREQITRQIAGFSLSYPKARVVVTSRILGYRRRTLKDAGFAHFTLQDFDDSQVETYVKKWYSLALCGRPTEVKERCERILHAMKDSPSIRQLAGNPMLLTIMAIIGKHQALPRERWKLYDHAASVLIEHWDVNKNLRDRAVQIDFIGEEDKKQLLCRLAYKMQTGSDGLARNYIDREQLQNEFEQYLKERWNQTADRATTIARAMIDQFHERNFVLSLFGANLYGFVHRAFLEYFCAMSLVHKFERTQQMTLEQLKWDVYGAHQEEQSWNEVLRLVCGMIDEGFAGNIIDYLTDQGYVPWCAHADPCVPWNIVLAVQCLEEVRNLNSIAESAKRLLSAICSLYDAHVGALARFHRFVQTNIIPSVRAIGANWPDRTMLADWLAKRPSYPPAHIYYHFYPESFGEYVGTIGAGLEEVHRELLNYLTQSDENYRALAPHALARGWQVDPKTPAMLRDLAAKDAGAIVRICACRALAKHYCDDPQTLPILHDLAVKDADADVRFAALESLFEYFRDDPRTLSILRERVVNDGGDSVRSFTVKMLAQMASDDDTLAVLLERVKNDESREVRMAALSSLSKYPQVDANVAHAIRDCIFRDVDDEVRSAALFSLAGCFSKDPETFSILHSFAEDPNEIIRSAVLGALARYFPRDPDTLSLIHRGLADDPSEVVRHRAMHDLVNVSRGDPKTVAILRDLAAKDTGKDVRICACRALVKHYCDDPQTLAILCDIAMKDAEADVRIWALRSVIEHFRNDPRTLSLIHERAVKDESPRPDDEVSDFEGGVRGLAICAVATFWPKHADTLNLLKDRAANDPTPWLRAKTNLWIAALASRYR